MATSKWVIDPAHSTIGFKIKHLMITNVSGHFSKFNMEVETEDEDFTTAKGAFTADTASVFTGNEERDRHLRSPDFFDDHQFPQIRFVPQRYEAVDNDGSYNVFGDLTIRDVTKPVELFVEFGGVVKDPWGSTRAGFTVNGAINRKDFGLHWSALTESGGLVVSDEVKLSCEIELVKQ
ncbi:YceI family protein [Chitinophaga japonensis]|uniref:Polyisoprenoid-binding protein YceI n=1 Tax=Chitinophaga japonensis TaxID=104662 RepID=A0A562SZ45_CHIJA|nr:YceI family protein [Chitinophaga japonensis]TWI86579.1 polyisoprenoid-binding protein YceI [Chitinophaga japonensis]